MKKLVKSVVIFIFLLGLVGCHQSTNYKEVDLTKNLKLEWYGFRGYAMYRVKSNKLIKGKPNKNMQAFLDSISYQAEDGYYNKFNGDLVEIEVKYDEDLAKKANVKVSHAFKKFTVNHIWEKTDTIIEGEKYYIVDGYEIPAKFVKTNSELYEMTLNEKAAEKVRNQPEQPKDTVWSKGTGTQTDLGNQGGFKKFSDAYEYGNRTNKQFRIDQVMDDQGNVTEYKVIFKD